MNLRDALSSISPKSGEAILFSGKPINFSNVCPIPVAPLRFDLTQLFDFNLLNAFINSLKVIVLLGMYYLLRDGIPHFTLFIYGEASQRFALPTLGRTAERRPTRKKIRRVKMLEMCAESPASGTRFVGRVCQRITTFGMDLTELIQIFISFSPTLLMQKIPLFFL